MAWSKETALDELRDLIAGIDGLKEHERGDAAHFRWLARTNTFLSRVFGPKSMYYTSIAALSWTAPGGTPLAEVSQWALDKAHHEQGYLKHLERARGLLQAAQDELERSTLDEVYRGKEKGTETSLFMKVLDLAERKLRRALHEKPEKEKQVQDAFATLLEGADVPYRREVSGFLYSTKTYIADFVVEPADLVVELKLCKEDTKDGKSLIEQINDDILAYQEKVANVLFIVYDLGQIRDVERFVSDFEKRDRVRVVVVKH